MTNEETKMMFEAHFTATRGMIMAMDDGINRRITDLDASVTRRFNTVDENNRIRNGRLGKAEDKIYLLEKNDSEINNYQKNCTANKIAVKLQKKWFWVAVAVIFSLAYFVLEIVYNALGLSGIINKLL